MSGLSGVAVFVCAVSAAVTAAAAAVIRALGRRRDQPEPQPAPQLPDRYWAGLLCRFDAGPGWWPPNIFPPIVCPQVWDDAAQVADVTPDSFGGVR